MTEYSYTDQPYLAEVFRYIAEHPPKPGSINHIFIEHDDWCPALLGTGYCICRPAVRPPKREELRRLRQMERNARKQERRREGAVKVEDSHE